MKKNLILAASAAVFLLVISCTSTPESIWTLLERGDERARPYFLSDVEVNATDPNGKTPLHYAVERRDAQLVSFFIALGANVNAACNDGERPLGISIRNNDADVTRLLATGNANIHLPLPGNQTPISFALSRDIRVFRALLTPATIAQINESGKTVLHIASAAGNLQAVQEILAILAQTQAPINLKDAAEKTALDYALENPDSRSHIEIAEQLILSGANSDNAIFHYFGPAVRTANYNIRRNEGLAPIHYAIIDNHAGMIAFLMDKNIDINLKSTSGATALHEAVRGGNITVINLLISKGADVNAVDAKGNTPLHTGIPPGVHREVITLLLEAGANPNLRDEYGDTPLHIAITLNRPVDVIQTLLSGGSDVHIRNMDGKTPLYIAVQENRAALVPVLVTYGSEIFAADNSGVTPFDIASRTGGDVFTSLITQETVNQRDSAGNTMLHVLVRNRGNPALVSRILDQRSPLDARNRDGDTALHIAVRSNQRETAEFLISRGSNIFTLNSAGHSPLFLALSSPGGILEWIINENTIQAKDGLGNNMLHYAAQWNMLNAIPVIIRNGISVEEPNATGQTPIFMALRTDSPSTIRTLVENNANINVRDSQGSSLLHSAVRWNAINCVPYLLSSGIDINVFSLNGNTPLHDSVALGMQDIETLLIEQGANLEVRNIDGNTPFMEAVRGAVMPSIERLAQSGADVSTRNTRGDTPLHIAVSMERAEIINLLLRRGASIHARNTRGRTPFQIALSISPSLVSILLAENRINISDDLGNSALHVAITERASVEIVRTIISTGARINAVDSNGKTPLRLAVDLETLDLARVIADAGADPFVAAIDNRTPAEAAFIKGPDSVRAIFSGRAINARDSSGNTILHIAARFGTPETIGILLELGANRTVRNIASESPFDIAIRWNREENAQLLR